MAYFNRFDICAAWLALESDWNSGGWLQERASNRRRREACSIQVERCGIHFPLDYCDSFESLARRGELNQMDIYVGALIQTGLNRFIDLTDETHASICRYIRTEYAEDWTHAHFPQLILGS